MLTVIRLVACIYMLKHNDQSMVCILPYYYWRPPICCVSNSILLSHDHQSEVYLIQYYYCRLCHSAVYIIPYYYCRLGRSLWPTQHASEGGWWTADMSTVCHPPCTLKLYNMSVTCSGLFWSRSEEIGHFQQNEPWVVIALCFTVPKRKKMYIFK